MSNTVDTQQLLQQAENGDSEALGQLLLSYEDRLLRIVAFRMDRRLRGRIDPTDVIQDTYVVATKRFGEFLRDRDMPFFLWLRFLALQKMVELHRHHLGTQARQVSREVSLQSKPGPMVTSAVLAAQLMGKLTTPSQAAIRDEVKARLEDALNSMNEIDREVVALRSFEQLSNAEAAGALGINESAASNRYMRAIRRLKQILDGP